MTVSGLIAALQQLERDNFGSCEVFYDSGPLSVLRPVGQPRVAFDAATKAAEVWLPGTHGVSAIGR